MAFVAFQIINKNLQNEILALIWYIFTLFLHWYAVNHTQPNFCLAQISFLDLKKKLRVAAETIGSSAEVIVRENLGLTKDFDQAVELLEKKGLAILCGPPGSGKTLLGKALQEHFERKGYWTRTLSRLCCQSPKTLRRKGRGVVLMDGGLGEVSVDTDQLQSCRELLSDSRRQGGSCLLVLTAYSHVLQELSRLEAGLESPFLEESTVVRLMRDPLNPTAALAQTVTTYMPLLQRMVHDRTSGNSMAALLALSMLGMGHFLHDPSAVRSELQRLGFHNVSCCDLDRLASNLKGSILAEDDPGFPNRVTYDTMGLVLGRSGLHPVLLKVCDAKFLVQYVHTSDTSAESLIPTACKENDRQLLMQRMHELFEKGDLRELCRHPSLGSPSFLKEFQDFCARNKREKYTRRLVDAVDAEHKLPLLYWSVWSPSPHFTQWCLKLTMEHAGNKKTLSETVLSAALATAFFTQPVETAKLRAKAFCEDLLAFKFSPASQDTLTLHLPQPDARRTTEKLNQTDDSKPCPKLSGRCYLDNPSLPIPAKLLSVTDTGEEISVKLSSQHWYLLLRLLTDRAVDETDRSGNTALHIAVDSKDLEAIRLVLKSGAALTAKNSEGLTPYHLSENRLLGCNFFKKTNRRKETVTALYHACENGDLETVKNSLCHSATLKDRGENNDTPLHVASRAGQTQAASLLIQLGADVQARNKFKVTPLHAACHSGHLATAKLLVQNGADVNAKAAGSRTPLCVAIWKGHADLVAFLVEQHADVNVKGCMGLTALHEACINNSTAVARLLLQHDIALNSRDSFGNTPLHHAYRLNREDMIKLLLDHKADVNIKNDRGWSPLQQTRC